MDSQGREPRLLDAVGDAVRVWHFRYRTEPAYVHLVKRFILFIAKRHPEEMGKSEGGPC